MPFSLFRKNRTPRKPHLANAGGLAAEIKDLRDDLFAEISGSIWATQTSWAINPTTGRDDNLGTPSSPLKTMAEFNNRMAGGSSISGAVTLQLVGDVIDEPLQLASTRLKLNASLTVSGTRTTIGSGTITTVTPIGNGGTTYPFQFTTTGIDWTTTPIGAQIQLQGGQICWIRNVIDANNIIVGAMTTLTSNAFFTPTNGLTFTVATLSNALPPIIAVSAATAGVFNGTQIVLQNLSFNGASVFSQSGCGVLIAGCEFKITVAVTFENNSQWIQLYRSCRFTMSASCSLRSANGRVSFFGGSFVTTSTIFGLNTIVGGDMFFLSTSFFRINLNVGQGATQISTGGVHFENITSGGCISIFLGVVFASGIVNGRNCTGASAGIDCQVGQFLWSGASNKPTIGIAAGCTNDVKLGSGATGLIFTYAQLGTGKQLATLDAAPPTTTQVQSGGYATVAQFA